MILNAVLYDGQSKPGSSRGSGVAFIHTVEPLKNALGVFSGYRLPTVGDMNLGGAIITDERDINVLSRVGVFTGVVYEVEDDLGEGIGVECSTDVFASKQTVCDQLIFV
jgi:hypothetical protein